MKIALFGYGKMGHEVELAARERGHEIVVTFDRPEQIDRETLRHAEAIVDFTEPASVRGNVEHAAALTLPIVIGTTGWKNDRDAVETMVKRAGIGCIVATNFSIGVNLFLAVVREAAAKFGTAGYDAYVLEAHHRMKKDYPSGTAITLANAMVDAMPNKSHTIHDLSQGEPIANDALLVSSLRSGSITGTHTVGFESDVDSVELAHRAKSRKGFALGAIRAAEWIVGRQGMYQFEEHVADIIGIGQ